MTSAGSEPQPLTGAASRLALTARFTDELGSGVFGVLSPTILRVFGLDLVGLAFLNQLLYWVALFVEPVASLLIDVRSRRALIVWGSGFVGAALLLMGGATGYGMLAMGFVAYGVGSGPLAHTADVVLIEAGGDDADRLFARATFFDTTGALLAPVLVGVASLGSVSWRVPLIVAAVVAAIYSVMAALATWPAPQSVSASGDIAAHAGLLAELRTNLRAVFVSARARRWLLFALVFELFEAPRVLRYVWLAEDVGMSQAVVAAYAIGEQVLALGALAVLERRLRTSEAPLPVLCLLTVVAYGLWLAAPGLAGKLIAGVPLVFAEAWLWPIGRSRTLQAVPGRAGAISAVTTLTPIIPAPILVGVLGEWVGLTMALAIVGPPAAVGLGVVALWARRADADETQPGVGLGRVT